MEPSSFPKTCGVLAFTPSLTDSSHICIHYTKVSQSNLAVILSMVHQESTLLSFWTQADKVSDSFLLFKIMTNPQVIKPNKLSHKRLELWLMLKMQTKSWKLMIRVLDSALSSWVGLLKSQEPLSLSNTLLEITGVRLDQLHWFDVCKDGKEEHIVSDFSSTEFQTGSNTLIWQNTFPSQRKFKSTDQAWEPKSQYHQQNKPFK